MPAKDFLSGLQFRFSPADNPPEYEDHEIFATHPKTGKEIGYLSWSPAWENKVMDVYVVPHYRRRGVATAMWNEANRIASESDEVDYPEHSSSRTDAGDKWAQSVSDLPLPERTKYVRQRKINYPNLPRNK